MKISDLPKEELLAEIRFLSKKLEIETGKISAARAKANEISSRMKSLEGQISDLEQGKLFK
jgi:hypothetical protein